MKRSQIPQRHENAERLEHPGGAISFPFSYFPNNFPEEPCEFRQACVILEGSNVAVGNRLGMSLSVCVRVCVCEKETVSALVMATQPFSLNQPEQLVSRVDAGHIVHTLTRRQTHTHTETAGPTLGQWRACDVRPEDTCGQTSPSSAAAAAGEHTNRWLKHNRLSPSPFLTFFSSSSPLLSNASPHPQSIHSSTPTRFSLSVSPDT